jgi:C-terminal processing protease CtpA/Prc
MRKNQRRWRRIAGAGALLLAAIALTFAVRTAEAATTWLGVYTQDLTQTLREAIDYRGSGVLVNRVLDGSPADEAGIEKGDVIVRFGSRQIDGSEELTDLVRESRSGQSVSVQIVRDGSRRTINVRLAERDDQVAPRAQRWTWSDGDDDRVRVRRAPRVHIERHDDDDDDGDGKFEFRIDGDDDEMLRIMPHLEELRNIAPRVRNMTFGRARLGVSVQDLNEGLGEYFESDKGALVTEVLDESPAMKAGIKAGDVITRFGGEEIEDGNDLIAAVRGADEGSVDVTVLRKGQTLTIRPDLEKRNTVWMQTEERRNLAERDRARAERQRERGDRLRDRADRGRGQELRREMEQLREELRKLERELETMDEDEE